MMLRSFWLYAASAATTSYACQSYGVDIGNGGIYYFDPNSQVSFSFTSGFVSCTGTTTPILQVPGGATYTCSTIDVTLGDVESVW